MNTPVKKANRRLVAGLSVASVGMLAFCYLALPPLYNLFCELAGIGNNNTGVVSAKVAHASEVDQERWVTVEFTGNASGALPWEFKPVVNKMRVHPGEVAEVNYFVRNTTNKRMVGQAIPSVTPQESSRYFNKTECFCFSNQVLEAGEAREMPVRFVVDSNLPKQVNTITLSYAFFDAQGHEKEES